MIVGHTLFRVTPNKKIEAKPLLQNMPYGNIPIIQNWRQIYPL
jgi:hypothetical protein